MSLLTVKRVSIFPGDSGGVWEVSALAPDLSLRAATAQAVGARSPPRRLTIHGAGPCFARPHLC